MRSSLPLGRESRPGAVIVLALLAVTVVAGSASAQLTQTLPRGFDSGAGGSGSAWPFNQATDHTWQWHYDSGQFNSIGQITITEVYVRELGGVGVAAFNFPSVELVMASSPTDYTVAGNGVQPGHSLTTTANLNPDATVVRVASPWIGSPPASAWLPLGLTTPFVYNPALGNDFVFQIRKCGNVAIWGQSIFGASGAAGVNGGNRYGSTSSCVTTTTNSMNNEYVPIIRIDYTEYNNLTISQSAPGVGDLTLSLSQLSPTGREGFTLLSANTAFPVGAGPLLGLVPDALCLSIFSIPYFPGNPFHFNAADAGVFPNAPFSAPPGSVSSLAGLTFDLTAFMLNVAAAYDSKSNTVRYTFQ